MDRFLCSEQTDRKGVRYMKKKIMIGAVVPLVVSLGLWFAMGSASATHTTHTAPAQHQTTVESGNQGGTESGNQGGTEAGNQGGTESDADAAAQQAACTAAGVDPNASNIQYDDQTGACSLDTGTDNSGESDGPGGHEDPAGNVDHQFDGQE